VCLAAGIFACVIGLELLVIDSAVVLPIDGRGSPQVVMAPDWAPWSLISAGAVTLLNFGTLPTRASKDLAKLAKRHFTAKNIFTFMTVPEFSPAPGAPPR
jgi:hypothetical protein